MILGIFKKSFLRGVFYFAFLAAALWFAFTYLADFMLFPVIERRAPIDLELEYLEVAPGVKIAMIYMPAEMAKYTVLYSYGNGGQLADLVPFLKKLNNNGLSVASYDYEGYGVSGGTAGEKNCYRDIQAVYRYLTEVKQIPPERIILWGFSLGSGPTCELASKYPSAGVILEAPFTSAFATVGAEFLPFDRFENYKKVARISVPMLVINGSDDMVINPEQGALLCAEAGGPKIYRKLGGVGHNDLAGHEEYWNYIDRFIEKALGEKYEAAPQFGKNFRVSNRKSSTVNLSGRTSGE